MIGSTRVSVSQAIIDLREHGLLKGTRGEYWIHLPALESLVEN
jgi:hypothetical protein